MPSKISIGRAALLAGLVCLTVGCASLDKRMKRFVGKPIDAVIKSYGVKPTEGGVKSENDRYAYLWRYTYYSYAGREYEGSSQYGPIITNTIATSATDKTKTAFSTLTIKASS